MLFVDIVVVIVEYILLKSKMYSFHNAFIERSPVQFFIDTITIIDLSDVQCFSN